MAASLRPDPADLKTDGYTSDEVCLLAEVSYRQLHYWSDRGYIRPSVNEGKGSGSKRRWSVHDCHLVALLGLVAGLVPDRAFPKVAQAVARVGDLTSLEGFLVVTSDGRAFVASAPMLARSVASRGAVVVLPLDF